MALTIMNHILRNWFSMIQMKFTQVLKKIFHNKVTHHRVHVHVRVQGLVMLNVLLVTGAYLLSVAT